MTTVLVSGAVANKHRHGGSVWVRMSWAEALRELGYEVLFVEQADAPTQAARASVVMIVCPNGNLRVCAAASEVGSLAPASARQAVILGRSRDARPACARHCRTVCATELKL